ncbi:MAG: hypothetical protein ABL900_09310 [Burkholderiaceae bacterium]
MHVEILGADAPRLQNFYRDLFGWQAKINPTGYGNVAVAPPAGTPLTGGVFIPDSHNAGARHGVSSVGAPHAVQGFLCDVPSAPARR